MTKIKYRGVNKGLHVLLSRTQAGPGKTVKQEQEEISWNHVQTFIYLSVKVLRKFVAGGRCVMRIRIILDKFAAGWLGKLRIKEK